MKNNTDIKAHAYAEVISEMTSEQKCGLLKELTALIQNQEARVIVSVEKGFPHLWRVLTGKQRKVKDQIQIDQLQINGIVCELLLILCNEQANQAVFNEKLVQKGDCIETILQLIFIWLKNHDKDIPDKSILEDLDELLGDLQDITINDPTSEVTDINQKIQDEISELQETMQEIEELQNCSAHSFDYSLINQQIVELVQESIHSAEDFETFIRIAVFKHVKGRGKVADKEIYWRVLCEIDGWKVEQWSGKNKDKYGRYRIIDTDSRRRAWTLDPQELITNLHALSHYVSNNPGLLSSLPSIAKILGVSCDTLKFVTEKKPYGIVKKRELLLWDNEKYWLVWDYIIWNEITLESVSSGQKVSMWQGTSDKEAQKQFDEIYSKLNGK